MTAWIAVLALLAHAVIMAAHVPPPLARLLAPAETRFVVPAAAEAALCHAGVPAVAEDHSATGEPADGKAPPAGAPGHVTYCPVCLSAQDGKTLGPATGPVPAMPASVAVAALPAPADPVIGGRPALPFSARAPPALV